MSPLLQNNYWFSAGAGGGFTVGNSLRFRGAQSLTRTTIPSPTDYQNYTFSCWVKRGAFGDAYLFNGGSSNSGGFPYDGGVGFNASNNARSYNLSNFIGSNAVSPGVYRDPSAWYHVVGNMLNSVTTTVYVNGVQQATNTSTSSSAIGTLPQAVGSSSIYTTNWLDGYMCEVYFIDGQTLTPDNFGEYNAKGVWVPKEYEGTYGNSGFYLDFSDPANIGADRSGNGNNFTPNGFELTNTASVDYDWMTDSPSTNFATFNPLNSPSGVTAAANLKVGTTTSDTEGTPATFGFSATGKFYWEFPAIDLGYAVFGVTRQTLPIDYAAMAAMPSGGATYAPALNETYINNVRDQSGYQTSGYPSPADGVYMCAYDAATRNFWLGVNGTWYNGPAGQSAGNPAAGTNPFFNSTQITAGGGTLCPAYGGSNTVTTSSSFNPGSRPFAYTPPTGFQPLTGGALPAATIQDPSDHFEVILDSGANILTAAQSKFSSGLWMIKDQINPGQYQFVDSLNGTSNVQKAPNDATSAYAAPSGTSTAYCWSAPETWSGGLRNTLAGFSIVQYVGNGGTQAVPHGLSQAPDYIMYKNMDTNDKGVIYHSSNPAYFVRTTTTQNAALASGLWTAPSSTDLNLLGDVKVNESGENYTAYCWHAIPGYASFGLQTGNDSADGPFVYTGLMPKLAMLKITQSTGSLATCLFDTVMYPYNLDTTIPNTSWAATSKNPVTSSFERDTLSNGYKIRSSGAGNSNNVVYTWCAWAGSPFGGSNVAPATAR